LEFGPLLSPTEIRPVKDAYFNHQAKYEAGRALEITPAEFPPDILRLMQRFAQEAHEALGLSIYSRTDFIVTESGPVLLETNNLPGFTPTSIIPQEAEHAGMEYSALITHLIETSLRHWHPLIQPISL
jgi:D-alanine-D-alanine ligase